MVALHCARNRNFYTAMTEPSEITKNDLLGWEYRTCNGSPVAYMNNLTLTELNDLAFLEHCFRCWTASTTTFRDHFHLTYGISPSSSTWVSAGITLMEAYPRSMAASPASSTWASVATPSQDPFPPSLEILQVIKLAVNSWNQIMHTYFLDSCLYYGWMCNTKSTCFESVRSIDPFIRSSVHP